MIGIIFTLAIHSPYSEIGDAPNPLLGYAIYYAMAISLICGWIIRDAIQPTLDRRRKAAQLSAQKDLKPSDVLCANCQRSIAANDSIKIWTNTYPNFQGQTWCRYCWDILEKKTAEEYKNETIC